MFTADPRGVSANLYSPGVRYGTRTPGPHFVGALPIGCSRGGKVVSDCASTAASVSALSTC